MDSPPLQVSYDDFQESPVRNPYDNTAVSPVGTVTYEEIPGDVITPKRKTRKNNAPRKKKRQGEKNGSSAEY